MIDCEVLNFISISKFSGKMPNTIIKPQGIQMKEAVKSTEDPNWLYDKNMNESLIKGTKDEFRASWLFKIGKDCTTSKKNVPSLAKILGAFDTLNLILSFKTTKSNTKSIRNTLELDSNQKSTNVMGKNSLI